MDKLRRIDLGAILIGLLILGVGIYDLLVNTFGLQLAELDWDKIWPLAVVALGIGIIWGAWSKMTPHGHGPTSTLTPSSICRRPAVRSAVRRRRHRRHRAGPGCHRA